ncbi:MAG TPA: TlpA disulfide reductase family protein [Rhodocyclaceae bacterium]|jgi:thiol-disulfide isomerase/thioredoxin|nr:TlpA disulfide reductase family protein [Rhodocyclaceae bacterium]
MKRYLLILIAVIVLIAAAALGFHFRQTGTAPQAIPADAAQKLLSQSFATLDGKATSLTQWQGKVLVVNFWATWCPPCREEMPEFSQIQSESAAKGVQFVGIAIDTPDNVLKFKQVTQVSYPLIIGSYDTLKLTGELGNNAMALPFTVILDRSGKIIHTKLGRLSRPELEQWLAPLVSAMQS